MEMLDESRLEALSHAGLTEGLQALEFVGTRDGGLELLANLAPALRTLRLRTGRQGREQYRWNLKAVPASLRELSLQTNEAGLLDLADSPVAPGLRRLRLSASLGRATSRSTWSAFRAVRALDLSGSHFDDGVAQRGVHPSTDESFVTGVGTPCAS